MCAQQAKATSQSLVVRPEHAGLRLDQWLVSRLAGSTRGQVVRLLGTGLVRVNGARAPKGFVLQAGDTVSVPASGARRDATPDPEVDLVVVHEDAHLVVVDKPAGVPTHPLAPGELGTIASGLVARYPEMAGVGHGAREPGLLHRLDNDTSGLVLAARDQATFDAMWALLSCGEVDKRYRTIAAGREIPLGVHDAYLDARGSRVRVGASPTGRGAEKVSTEILASETLDDHCLLHVRARRAKRHQIRAHLAYLGSPVYGDRRYGGVPAADGGGHCLHASEMQFRHPMTGREVVLTCELPAAFAARIERLSRG